MAKQLAKTKKSKRPATQPAASKLRPDPALIALVKYLARRAAQRDYEASLKTGSNADRPSGGTHDSKLGNSR